MSSEIWKPVKGFEGRYEVSSLGRVRSLLFDPAGRIMKTKPDAKGYVRIGLQWNTHKLVHRLVAEAFIPNPDGLPAVNHIDGNQQNNAASNLEWVSHSDNMRHSWRNLATYANRVSRNPKGERSSSAKLTASKVRAIRAAYGRGTSQRVLAARYGVTKPAIQAITSRRTWKHI